MRKLALIASSCLLLTGCGAAVDLAFVSGAVSVLEPIVNNNPNAKSNRIDNRRICYYQISEYTIKADVCPVGVKEGTRIYKY